MRRQDGNWRTAFLVNRAIPFIVWINGLQPLVANAFAVPALNLLLRWLLFTYPPSTSSEDRLQVKELWSLRGPQPLTQERLDAVNDAVKPVYVIRHLLHNRRARVDYNSKPWKRFARRYVSTII